LKIFAIFARCSLVGKCSGSRNYGNMPGVSSNLRTAQP